MILHRWRYTYSAKGSRSGSIASQTDSSVIVLIGAQRVARSTSHYSVDGTTIVAGPSKLLLETDNVLRSVTIVAVAAVITAAVVAIAVVAVAVVGVAIVASTIAIVARPISVVTGAISVTVGIAIAVRIISIAIRIAEERETKAAYENEIIKVIVVMMMIPMAAVPVAIPIAAVPVAVPIAAVE